MTGYGKKPCRFLFYLDIKTMIKISSQDWLRIGTQSGWILIKESQVEAGFTVGFPGQEGGSTSSVASDRAREFKNKGDSESEGINTESTVASVLGLAQIAQLIKRKNKNVTAEEASALATKIHSGDIKAINKGIKKGYITAEEGLSLRKSIINPRSVTKSNGIGKGFRNAAGWASAAAGGAVGYYGTNAIADQLRGNNSINSQKIKEKIGNKLEFSKLILKMHYMFKNITGISKSLDRELNFMSQTIKDIDNQMEKK